MNSRVTSLKGLAKMSSRECINLWLCNFVQTQRSALPYFMRTGWTGRPGLKAPALNLARYFPLVVVPSENMKI